MSDENNKPPTGPDESGVTGEAGATPASTGTHSEAATDPNLAAPTSAGEPLAADHEPAVTSEPTGSLTRAEAWKSRVRESVRRARERALLARDHARTASESTLTNFKSPEWRQQMLKQVQARILAFEPAMAVEWASKTFQKQGASFYGTAATIALCTYFLANLTGLLLGRFVPEPPLARAVRGSVATKRPNTLQDYEGIFARNLFSSQGVIPGEESTQPGTPTQGTDPGGPPVKTSLPFTLVGTMILQNELRSIATIEDKSASMVYPVRIEDEIPAKARIIKIEPRRVIFVNTASGRREFVELPDDPITGGPRISLGTPGGRASGGAGIEKVSPTQFNVSRSEVDKSLADLNNVLTQARAVPNFENGQPNGYKLFQIVPGSIYDKLGLQNGDVVAGLNGATINDPGKAFEMLSELKSSNHLELQVKRDGKASSFSYDIR